MADINENKTKEAQEVDTKPKTESKDKEPKKTAKKTATKQAARKKTTKKTAEKKDESSEIKNLEEKVNKLSNTMLSIMDMFEQRVSEDPNVLSFKTRNVVAADQETRETLYKRNNVYAKKGELVRTSDVVRRDEDFLLKEAAASVPKRILSGTITGYQKMQQMGGIWMAELVTDDTEGQFVVYIPFYEFMPYDPKDFSMDDYIENELKARLNSNVEFVVTEVFEEDGFAVASRLAALSIRGQQLFTSKSEKYGPRIAPGMITNATIISVRTDRVYVTIDGADAMIKPREMSWTSLQDLVYEFKVGQVVPVKVLSLEKEKYTSRAPEDAVDRKDYPLWKCELSVRQALTDPRKLYYNQFKVGQVVSGEVKRYVGDKSVFVKIAGKMDCICFPPKSGRPVPGSEVKVKIDKMESKDKRIFGLIID